MFKFLKRKFVNDPIFKDLLNEEFSSDLIKILYITSIPLYDRSDEYDSQLDYFKSKYKLDGDCPSGLFEDSSRNLQETYMFIHNQICSLLYSKLDRALYRKINNS